MLLRQESISQFGHDPDQSAEGSKKTVVFSCDYCGAHDSKGKRELLKQRETINKDACRNCASEKKKEIMMLKYGVTTIFQREEVKAKIVQTNIEKYGTASPVNYNPEIMAKKKKTNLDRYGAENAGGVPASLEKIKQKMLSKYGVDHPMKHKGLREQRKKTFLEKYGVEFPGQSPELQAKVRATHLKRTGIENPFYSTEIQELAIQTRFEKYGTLLPINLGRTENEIRAWVNSFGYNFQSNIKILKRKEIDMYDNSLKLAIEYCGLHWHHEHSPEPRLKNYHINKYKICLEQGIRLITIFEDEWLNRQEQVKGFLLSVLGKNSITIGARQCKIIEVAPASSVDFCNKNHIQISKQRPKVSFGLEYNGNLVGLMSFGKHHRQQQEDCVLTRLCFLPGYTVIGGSSRLFRSGIEWAKNQGYEKIISWSDNRWSQGNVYSKIGFTLDKEWGADYAYVPMKRPTSRIAKQNMQKKFINCPVGTKEHEHALTLGFSRIWDCGKKRWIYNL